MLKPRLIPVIVVKEGLAVQSIGFKSFLPIGRPRISVEYFNNWDVDEIIVLDISRSQAKQTLDQEWVASIANESFVPITFGGGINSVADISRVLQAGADKISINSAALKNPAFISEAAAVFGRQCIVVSIDFKHDEVFSESGQKPGGLSPVEWAKKAEQLGAGEILLNSIERDGSKSGYDLDVIRRVSESVQIPVIACGGAGTLRHLQEALQAGASAVAAANMLQFTEHSTILGKAYISQNQKIRLATDANYAESKFDENGRLIKKEDLVLENL